jgi:hypothetical protein
VELTSLFANQGLTAPPLDFTVSGRVRAGTTCRAEVLAAFNRLDGDGPPRWHSRDEVIAEVRRVTQRYPAGTIRRILGYDLAGRATMNHVATSQIERRRDSFRRLENPGLHRSGGGLVTVTDGGCGALSADLCEREESSAAMNNAGSGRTL